MHFIDGTRECRNGVMDGCEVANCAVSCSGDIANQGFVSVSIDGVNVSVFCTFLFYCELIKSVSFKPVGSEGATCTVTCDDLEFTTTCQASGNSFEWSRPQNLIDKCGKIILSKLRIRK